MQFKQYPDSFWRGLSNSVLLLLFTANWRFLPSDFSFWVAANMPLDDNLRLQILSINCPTQRLRRELEIVRKVSEGYDWFAHWKFSGSSQSYRFLGGGTGKNIRRPGWLGRSELSMRLRRENMMDARAHHVSSYLNSTAPFPFKVRPRMLVLSGRLRSPKTRFASGWSRRLHENQVLGSTDTVAKTRTFLRAENTFFV